MLHLSVTLVPRVYIIMLAPQALVISARSCWCHWVKTWPTCITNRGRIPITTVRLINFANVGSVYNA
jgi:hypothetical protein